MEDISTREIPLKNSDLVTVVDADYFDWLMGIEWRLSNAGYVFYNTTHNGKPFNYLMHRLVNDTPDGLHTDHINGDRLNNTRDNLRTVTHAQNVRNRRITKRNTSGYKGVSWNIESKKWQVKINIGGKLKHIGQTHDLIEGAIMYNEAAIKYHGQHAALNNIPERNIDSVQLTI